VRTSCMRSMYWPKLSLVFWSNIIHNLKYLMFTTLSYKDIGIRKSHSISLFYCYQRKQDIYSMQTRKKIAEICLGWDKNPNSPISLSWIDIESRVQNPVD